MADIDTVPEAPILRMLMEDIESLTPEQRVQLDEAAARIVSSLAMQATEQVAKKQTVETRWLEDLRQYHGRYSTATEAELAAGKGSKVFANLTRPKTNGWAARFSDLLFPTDDKNWGIKPTPVPDLAARMQGAQYEARRLTKAANFKAKMAATASDSVLAEAFRADSIALAKQAEPHAAQAMQDQQVVDEAEEKADGMETELEDQLVEAGWGPKARRGIMDLCKLGTFIGKGPTTKTRVRGKWEKNTTTNEWVLKTIEDPRPGADRVDPWAFFPDMNARTIDEAEFFYERHLLTKTELRKLARKPGFDADAIRRVLQTGSMDPAPTYLTQLREITGAINISLENRYVVWEYSGPLTGEDIASIAKAILPPKKAAILIAGLQDDPLIEQRVVLWFSNNIPIKIGPHPLDSGDPIYVATSFFEDESSIFGFGVPYLARNSQAIINGAWRMIMNNGDAASGPQVVVNQNIIEPGDNEWALEGFKIWRWKTGKQVPPGTPEPFQVFQTNSQLQYLLEVIKLAMIFMDEEVSLPLIAQGEQASHITQTAGGMSMLMNAANVIFRLAVRNWDDNITTPLLTRFYDWNMQHSSKEHLKGDMTIEARGSSVLLERQSQSQNLMAFLSTFGSNPKYERFFKDKDSLDEIAKTMSIKPSAILKSDQQVEQEDQERAANPPPDPPEVTIAREKNQTSMQIEMIRRETAMITMANDNNMTIEQISADLQKVRAQIQADLQKTAIDAALTQRQMTQQAMKPDPKIATTGTVQ